MIKKTEKFSLLTRLVAFCLLTLLSLPEKLQANHLVGGEMSYECLGGNQFEIVLRIYRDCDAPNAAPFDDPARIFFYNSSGSVVDQLNMGHEPSGDVFIPPDTDDICVESIPVVCVEFFEYRRNITLPPIPGGYRMVHQRCCRNTGIVNITFPGDTGSTYELLIPHESGGCDNSSPVFNNDPPLIICEDFPFEFDFSATDLDGDSLVYSICSPFEGANPIDPEPGEAGQVNFPFPYGPLQFSNGHSSTNQLGNGSTLEIDPVTGNLLVVPDNSGLYVVGICVEEFRDGLLIGTSVRDFQFNITPCEVVSASVGAQATEIAPSVFIIQDCTTFDVLFENTSIGATEFFWDFGDPDNPGATSMEVSPIYEYPDTGTYEIMLIADPGELCSDTATILLNLFPLLIGDFDIDGGECRDEEFIFEDETELEGDLDDHEIDSWMWSFGDSTFSTLQNPTHEFDSAGEFEVTFTVGTNFGCAQTLTETIEVFPIPNAFITFESACLGEEILFESANNNVNDIESTLWDFDDPGSPDNTATTEDATHTFNAPGEYSIELTQVNQFDCDRTRTRTITIFPELNADIGNTTSACVGEDIQIDASITGGDENNDDGGNIFVWSPTDILSDSTVLNPIVSTNENVVLTLTVTDPNECVSVDEVTIMVDPLPVIDLDETISVCFQQSVELNVGLESNTTSFEWSPNSDISNVNIENPIVSPTDTTTYFIEVENSFGCVAVDSIVVQVQPEISIGNIDEITICENDSVVISVPSFGGAFYEWSPAESLNDPTLENPIAFPTETTTYTVEVSNDCFSDMAELTVNVNPAPFVDAGEDASIVIGQSVTLNGTGDAELLWTPAAGVSDVTIANPEVSPVSPTTYFLTTFSDLGCPATDSVFVDISFDIDLIVPTAFSPNGDGVNDVFRLFPDGINEVRYFRIYNRWGEIVFDGEDITSEWDGTFNGEMQDIGVYVVVIRAVRPVSSDMLFQGNVTLIR